MRVRPFFWLLLLVTCMGVIIFAFNLKTEVPALMQVHLEQPHPTVYKTTGLLVHLTDPQGLPIEQAHAVVNTNMANMDMGEQQLPLVARGQGTYETNFMPSMAGPWVVTIQVHADGFVPLHQQVFIQVK